MPPNSAEPAVSGTAAATPAAAPRRAHVIVVGNEKGGSGKTTTTMHLLVALLRLGFSVGSMDLDSRQRSLTRYIENRRQTIAAEGIALPSPQHFVINKSPFDSSEEAKADEKERFAKGLAKIYGSCDFVIIDTPGNDTFLSRLAHSFAQTVITPINDSFVDLDVLAAVDGATLNIVKPSIYAEMVWEQKLSRAKRDGGSIDWIVMRNRLSNIDARNKRFMAKVTEELARRVGFRVAPGLSERVIFREMFLQGLTVLDVLEAEKGGGLSISHVAARQEVRNLLAMLRIPEVDRRIEKLRAGEEGKKDAKAEATAKPAEAPIKEKVVGESHAVTPSKPDSAASASGAAKVADESAGFSLSKEQQLTPQALVSAKAELARASVLHAPKPGVASVGEASASPMPVAASADDGSVYPSLPTPAFSSPSATRAPLVADPALPEKAPETTAAGAKAPALTSADSKVPDVKAGPNVPASPGAVELTRAQPAIRTGKSDEALPGATKPDATTRPPSDDETRKTLSRATASA